MSGIYAEVEAKKSKLNLHSYPLVWQITVALLWCFLRLLKTENLANVSKYLLQFGNCIMHTTSSIVHNTVVFNFLNACTLFILN